MAGDAIAGVKLLTRDFIENNLQALIEMSKQLNNDYWAHEHYMADLDRKWELSSYATVGDTLGGFIIVSEKPESLHVNRVVVSPQLHKTGIGKIFIQKAIADCKRLQKPYLTLKVDSVNENAIGFYKKLQFETTGTQGDLLLMRLKID